MQSKKIKGITHSVYDDLDEFQKEMPDTNVFFDWRSGNEGDWVFSDDNKVIQLLKVSRDIKHPSDMFKMGDKI